MSKTYQYLPLIKPKASLRLIPRILKTGAHIIVDLEDSVQDTLNPENTPNLKAVAREGLRLLVDEGAEYFQTKKIGVRINAMNTPEYAFDIEAVCDITSRIAWDAIWLPMVDSPEMIMPTGPEKISGNVSSIWQNMNYMWDTTILKWGNTGQPWAGMNML